MCVVAAEILWLDGERRSDGGLVGQQELPADAPLHNDVVSKVQQQRRGVIIITSGAKTKGRIFLMFPPLNRNEMVLQSSWRMTEPKIPTSCQGESRTH